MDFTPPTGLVVAALLLGGLLSAIVPTCLYLYVEPRSRRMWAAQGDTPATRRAPWLVRASAWLGFAVGQAALPMLLVPVLCGGLLYAQIRLGHVKPVSLGLTALLGLVALAQSVLALRLFPLGVKLLARDAAIARSASTRARFIVSLHGGIVALGVGLVWAFGAMPSLVHPVLRATLEWAALRPVIAYAGVSVLHALLLARASRVLTEGTGSR